MNSKTRSGGANSVSGTDEGSVENMIKSLVKKVDTLVTKDNLKSLETKFDTGIQRIATSVESLKSEVREVKDMSNELQKSLEFERNRVDKALEEISKKNAELEEKLILLEKHDRKYNILIYGCIQFLRRTIRT
ncbi:hypothetical protein SNE40_017439 [Patella caerulea]|uniref:Uncharacterized protein n=1 Tax=Patella caerulea TaxID=87958 RepID=A0AAN8JDW5_PATCE